MLHSSHISCPRRSRCWAKSIHFRLAYLDNNRNTKNCTFPLKWSETWCSHFLILLAGKSVSYFTNVSPFLALSSYWDHFQPFPAIIYQGKQFLLEKIRDVTRIIGVFNLTTLCEIVHPYLQKSCSCLVKLESQMGTQNCFKFSCSIPELLEVPHSIHNMKASSKPAHEHTYIHMSIKYKGFFNIMVYIPSFLTT